jgi:hypothetical protein
MRAGTSAVSAPIRAGAVVRAALTTGRRRFRRVASAALVVFSVAALVDLLVAALIDWVDDGNALVVVATLLLSSFAAIGFTFFAGLLDHTVAEDQHGEPTKSVGAVLRTLPYGRLLLAGVLLAVGAGVLALALLIPGLVFYTYFSLVGPIINMEDRSVRAAFRRSRQLVRSHFKLTFLLVTLPVLFEQEVVHGVELLVDPPLWLGFLVNVAGGALIGSVVALVDVTLAYRLVAAAPAPVSRGHVGRHHQMDMGARTVGLGSPGARGPGRERK